jgi:murein L,D-transpeptidase YcbB/YkuD
LRWLMASTRTSYALISRWIVCAMLIGSMGVTTASADLPSTQTPFWFDADRPSVQAQQAVQILLTAADEGLEPHHYQAADLNQAVTQASAGSAPTPSQQVQLDAALTQAMQHYLSDLSRGRVNPSQIKANFSTPGDTAVDVAAWLRMVVREQRLRQAVTQLAAQTPMAAPLRQALAQYRALVHHPAWQSPLAPLPGRKLEPGQAYAGLPLLTQRLQALGDLADGIPVPARLEGDVIAALMRFQERHGLTPDGVLGAKTMRQLNIMPEQRAQQIALTLERLRWTPLRQAARMVVVNVPEFVLRAYEVQDGHIQVKLTMKVIVGKALDTRTPLFDEEMRFIEFSPYWNVPPSIARQETVPHLRADPDYLARQDMEFVTASGQVVTTLAPEHLDAVLSGAWRIRQRPGPKNALGDIKFVFPNNSNIYLHHTPSPAVPARPAGFQPWLHPHRRPCGARPVCVAQRSCLARTTHPRGHGPWPVGHAAPGRSAACGDCLQHRHRQAGKDTLLCRPVRPGQVARPGPAPAVRTASPARQARPVSHRTMTQLFSPIFWNMP